MNREDSMDEAAQWTEDEIRSRISFLAALSHEIRTPMNSVTGLLELLQSSSLTDDQLDVVNLAYNSSASLLRVIDDILDYSKIEAGKLSIEEQEMSIRDIVEEATQTLQINAQSKNVDLLTFIDLEIDNKIMGDSARLKQILLNLAGNAIKFTANGVVRIGVVPQSVTPEQLVLQFEVSDTGIGLSEEQINKLFKPFSQAEESTSSIYGGTGLGLAISKNIVELMGGEIGVDSKRGEGSTFWFRIPFKRLKGHDVVPGNPYDNLRILFCTDLGPQRGTGLTRYLEKLGAECQRVDNVDDTMSALMEAANSSRPFDFLLTTHRFSNDQVMTIIENIELLPELTGIPIVLYGPRQLASVHELMDTKKFTEVIFRPLRLSQVCQVITNITGRPIPKFIESSVERSVHQNNHGYIAPTEEKAAEAGAVILIAEDNRMNQIVIGRQLTRLGYVAEFANDGLDAWRKLNESKEKKKYGFLFADCHMPIMDGFELSKRIRKSEEKNSASEHLPIVALTADALGRSTSKASEAGMDDYLSKPVRLATLDTIIQKWLPKAHELRKKRL